MIDVNELRRGVTFSHDGELYKVLEYHHNKPGRGKATIRVQVRNIRTGTTREMSFISGDRVEDIRLETKLVEYLYKDAGFLHFMDLETYEQPVVAADTLGEDIKYVEPNTQLKLSFYDGEVIDYELPITVEQEVTESEMAVAGDTATGATKQVITSNGLKVTVPLFVEVGDVIRIDTRTGEYLTRV